MTVPLGSDTQGRTLQAHDGGILHFEDRWHEYGENRDGPTSIEYAVDRVDRVNFIGVSCYSSSDLLHWTDEGLASAAVQGDPWHDPHPSRVNEGSKSPVTFEHAGRYHLTISSCAESKHSGWFQ